MFWKSQKRRRPVPHKSDRGAEAISVEDNSQPPPFSQRTVSVMVQLLEHLAKSERPWSILGQFFDEDRIYDALFSMNCEREFLDKCRDEYYWNFRRLLPALNDGSFFADLSVQRPFYHSRGQAYLRAFATLLSGVYLNHPDLASFHEHRTALASTLEGDGWRFDGMRLRELRKATIDEPKETSLVAKLIDSSNHDRKNILLHHFENGHRLYEEGKYHPCAGEWRAFLEELMRGIWRLTRLRRSEYKTYAETPSIADLFKFLRASGFLDADEEQAFRSSFGFLSAGGHPGIGEKDDAYLSQILALTFGHALLLKLDSWHAGNYQNF